MHSMTVLQLIGLIQPKAFVTIEHIDTGLRLNHFQQIACLVEQFNDPHFFKAFKIVGEIIVPTYSKDQDEVVMAVFSHTSFMETYNETSNVK